MGFFAGRTGQVSLETGRTCRVLEEWTRSLGTCAGSRTAQSAAVDATDATFNRGKLTAVSPPTQARGDDAA